MTFFTRLGWRPRIDEEVDEELAFHLEMRTRELIARGMDPAAARHEAARRFGDLTRMGTTLHSLGHGRDMAMRRTQYLGELRQDIAFTWRQMIASPGFTAIAILTLALGIGGTTAIFSALYAVVLQPIAIREPDRLLLVGETFQGQISSMSVGIYIDAVGGTQAFEGLAAERFSNVNLSDGITPERVSAGYVTANFFSVMGASPTIGRTFTADEDQPGTNHVIVLSHRLWLRRFGASASVLNRPIRMNGVNYTITGVMPESFDLTADTEELWAPIAFTPEQRVLHDEHYLTVYGRLKAGVSSERARAELEAVAVRVRHDFPKDAKNLVYGTRPFREQFVGDYRARLLVLMAAVGIVLLIACGNVANLLLARGAARAREIALRAALGAGRWRIVRQLLTESVALALIAAGAGLVLAKWFITAVIAWSPGGVPRLDQAHLSPVALGFAAAIALFSSIVSGLVPSLRLARTDVQNGLRDGGRGSTGGGLRDRVRAGLIVGEVALSLLLLFGAGLLIRSAIALQHVNPGFDPAGVLAARFSLPETVYGDIAREKEVLRRIHDAAAQLPRVTSAAVTSFAAMGGGGGSNGLLAEENGTLDPQRYIVSTLRLTTPGFFNAMRTPILKGRAFMETDRAGGQKVMIISEALAARAFPGQDPIGKRIACCESGPDGFDRKVVVGLAGDIRSRGPAVAPSPEFYLPMAQAPDDAWHWFRAFYVVIRTDGDPAAAVEPLRGAFREIDPELPLFDVRTMNERLSGTLATARFNTLLLTLLGAIGLVLAAGGIYGVIAYFVTERTQEIGVRIALGATRGDVLRLILGQAMPPVAIGTAAGLAAAVGASRVLSSQLFGVSRSDPLTIAAVIATLIGVALVASALPARRAAEIDPARALQAE